VCVQGAVWREDDTFLTWPHGPEELKNFLNHLNIHSNVQFTVETEYNGHLPFLDIDIYRKPDGSLEYSVYRKPTHTNFCLCVGLLHHLTNKLPFS